MNRYGKILVLLAALLVATGVAVAANSKLYVADGVEVNGERLRGGEYFVGTETVGDDLVVVFRRGSREVARAKARWVELDAPATRTTARLRSEEGKREIVTITFEGEARSLKLERD